MKDTQAYLDQLSAELDRMQTMQLIGIACLVITIAAVFYLLFIAKGHGDD